MNLTAKQLESVRQSIARVNIWHGAIRSGKTVGSLVRFMIAIASAPSGGEIVITGRTREAIYRNILQPLMSFDLFGKYSRQVQYNPGAPTARILGRIVHIIGASDAKAEAVIRGMTVALWYADEITVHPEGFVTQMLGRMSVSGAQMFGTTNPEGQRHWFKTKFLDRADQLGWAVWKFVLDDNPTLDADFVASIKAEYTGVWYRRFILGEWTNAEGAVFDMFDELKHVIRYEDLPKEMDRILGVGVDYGTTNAFAALRLGLSAGQLYLMDEYRHDVRAGQPTWTDPQLSRGLRDWLKDGKRPQDPEPEWVIIDPSAASFRAQLRQDGLQRVMEANNSVIDGIRTVSSQLATGGLQITNRCPGLIDEIPGYVWDKKATEKGDDRPVKEGDHSIDAMRYAVHTTQSNWRRFRRTQGEAHAAA